MKTMILMLANNTGRNVRNLWKQYPDRFACMFGLTGWRNVPIPYACDNGRFIATTKNKPWVEKQFAELLEKSAGHTHPPIFVTTPDVVADRDATLREWDKWTHPTSWFMSYDFPRAFVAQDGMTPDDVPENADWVFIGGSQKWKRQNIYRFCRAFENVHVGGINSSRGLWHCHESGAKSIDGTGWCRGDKKQWIGLLQYLYRSQNALGEKQGRLFSMYEADAMGARMDRKSIQWLQAYCMPKTHGDTPADSTETRLIDESLAEIIEANKAAIR
jgi:hypothetical protein